ncbi:hypothetical protein ABZ527_36435 [Streptomyces griseofuscus]|uniref:hypothetical protein n=1 Tax=Streptomyces griseofuscus TaxID=146922 RepID=UPI0033E2C54C
MEYSLCHTEDHAEHRIVGGDSKHFNLFFPLDPDLTEDAPLVYGLEFTDMTELRWRRIGNAQPVRLIGNEAEVPALAIDLKHDAQERAATCGGSPPIPGQ